MENKLNTFYRFLVSYINWLTNALPGVSEEPVPPVWFVPTISSEEFSKEAKWILYQSEFALMCARANLISDYIFDSNIYAEIVGASADLYVNCLCPDDGPNVIILGFIIRDESDGLFQGKAHAVIHLPVWSCDKGIRGLIKLLKLHTMLDEDSPFSSTRREELREEFRAAGLNL